MESKQIYCASIITGLIALPLTTTAFADCPSGCLPAPCGWYVELNVGYSKISNVNFPGSATNQNYGGNLNLGYKFMPYFGMELGYTQFGNTKITAFNQTVATIKHYAYDLAAKGIIPMGCTGFEFFAKFGVQRNNVSVSINNTVATFFHISNSRSKGETGLFLGLGGEYYSTSNMAVVFQWQRTNGNSTSGVLDLYSIGVNYIFS